VLPGVVGAICLLLAAYALQLLSVNYAGVALIALGVLLMIMEVFMPSFGSLGIGGVIAFVIGSIILLDTDVPGFGIPRAVIGSVAFVGGSARVRDRVARSACAPASDRQRTRAPARQRCGRRGRLRGARPRARAG
jgi:membrane-bound ClpP family serine protease